MAIESVKSAEFPCLTRWAKYGILGDWRSSYPRGRVDEVMQTVIPTEPEEDIPWQCSPGSVFRASCQHYTAEEAKACPYFAG